MEDDDYDGLPLYIEEDEEAAAAEKQKRRQQSRKPPPPPPTPEEIARREVNEVMLKKLYEYDPKLGSGCYTQVWFLDFTKFDLDEENVGYPINVYGTVIIRDGLDMKCNYIFRRDRDNCQPVESEGESLILTGPSRGVVFLGDAYFEINLKIKGDKESDDRQFNKALIDVVGSRINYLVRREPVESWLSEVDLIFSHVKKALEGTIEIKLLSGPESFRGKITACTTDVLDHMLLYGSDVDGVGCITAGDDGVIQLLRRVVAVSVDQRLVLNICACSGDQNGSVSHRSCKFAPLMKGSDMDEITCGLYKLRVKVIWSTLE